MAEGRGLASIKRRLKKWEKEFEAAYGRKASKSDVESGPDEIKALYRQYQTLRHGGSSHGNRGSRRAEKVAVKNEELEEDGVFGRSLNKANCRSKKAEEIEGQARRSIWNLPPPPAAQKQKLRPPNQRSKVFKAPRKELSASLQPRPPPPSPSQPHLSPGKDHSLSHKVVPLTQQHLQSLSPSNDHCSSNSGMTTPLSQPHPPSQVLHMATEPHSSPSGPIFMAAQERGLLHTHVSKAWLDRCLDNVGDTPSPRLSGPREGAEGVTGTGISKAWLNRCPGNSGDTPSACSLKGKDLRGEHCSAGGILARLYSQGHEEEESDAHVPSVDFMSSFMEEEDVRTEAVSGALEGLARPELVTRERTGVLEKLQAEKIVEEAMVLERVIAGGLEEEMGSPEGDTIQAKRTKNLPMGTSEEVAETSAPTVKGKSVSENYVRLNMKVKRYSRRPGRSLTGSAYKRQAWKRRQRDQDSTADSVGRGGRKGGRQGRFVCFKCGGTGHWARNCKERGGSANLGSFSGQKVCFDEGVALAVDEELDMNEVAELAKESLFPTLREAAKMVPSSLAGTLASRRLDTAETEDSEHSAPVSDETTPPALDPVISQLLPPPPDLTTHPPPPAMKPLFELDDGCVPATPSSVLSALRELGFSGFRPRQEETVMRILSGVSTLLITSTGSGKSLCYQLPAYLYARTRPPCITLVISPLVSLMDDQVRQFPKKLKGACLHTNQTRPQRARVLKEVAEGHVDVLLLSPEALVGGALWSRHGGVAHSLHDLPPVAFACIDEAHCISEWSHNFRPSYLRLHRVLNERFGVRCVLGLTATATHMTSLSVAHHLGVASSDIIRGPELPDNLHITVSCDQDRDQALVDLLDGPIFGELDSIIVYCTRQQTAETLAQMLRTCLQPWNHSQAPTKRSKVKSGRSQKEVQVAECYHAGMAASQRKSIQNKFMSGRLRIVVATVAFGMGLNKKDIRGVIHYNIPKSFEAFVQEIGRAGRDGSPAHCHVFIDKEGLDAQELTRHIHSNSVDPYAIKKLVEAVFPACQCTMPEATTCPSKESGSPERQCRGHEVTIPIEATVTALDTREECLMTLLCHLEQHGWLRVRNHTHDTCTLKCYGGPRQLRALAGKVPAVAAAVAVLREQGEEVESNHITFSVTSVASRMGWESKVMRSELTGLQVNDRGTCPIQTSGCSSGSVLVEMDELAFNLVAPGDLEASGRETVITLLRDKVKVQERRETEKLQLLQACLRHMATETHDESRHSATLNGEAESSESSRSTTLLRDVISQYFSEDGLSPTHLVEKGISLLERSDPTAEEEELIGQDVAALVSSNSDQHFTGRTLARIFHGIPSPLFPAVVWGKGRFWRKYLHLDFNKLCSIATKKLLEHR